MRETLSITDRTYLIHEGKIFLEGTPSEVAENPMARKFYLGDHFDWQAAPAPEAKGEPDVKPRRRKR